MLATNPLIGSNYPLPPSPDITTLVRALSDIYKRLANAVNTLWSRKAAPNWSTGPQLLGTGDTYLVGSNVKAPNGGFRAGTIFRWRLGCTKTAAGVANPQFIVRVGVHGSIADAAILTFTMPAQTGVLDSGVFEFFTLLQVEGTAAVMTGLATMGHALAATGFSVQAGYETSATSSPFDGTVANIQAGISANFGPSSAVTAQLVTVEALNLT